MQKIIDKLFYLRLTQMSIMLFIGLCCYVFSKIPHVWWVMMTMYMMLGSVEPGLVKAKSINRAKGTLMGLVLFFPTIYLLQFNYRLIPLVLMCSVILVGSISPKRYDITVIFITFAVLSSTAYSFTTPTIEGTLQMELNRGLNTLIAITIVFIGEYFMFKRFRYAYKACFIYQLMVRKALLKAVRKITKHHGLGISKNKSILFNELSQVFLITFNNLVTSSTSLLLSSDTKESEREQILTFNSLAFAARRKILALYYNTLIAHNSTSANQELMEIHQIIKRMAFIQIK